LEAGDASSARIAQPATWYYDKELGGKFAEKFLEFHSLNGCISNFPANIRSEAPHGVGLAAGHNER
jgi:hypothetical protein